MGIVDANGIHYAEPLFDPDNVIADLRGIATPPLKLAHIMEVCSRKSSTFTLKVHTIYGLPTMKLQGYHVPGETPVEFPYDDMVEFPDTAFNMACNATSCDMSGRPSKQPGFAHSWPMVCVGKPPESPFGPRSKSHETIEKYRDQRVMEDIDLYYAYNPQGSEEHGI